MPKTFYIIDGHAQIFRAYFAPFRDLTSPSGEPTKATFVFTQMLINLVQQRKPDYLAMVIDQGGDETVFRKEIYPEYKANRKEKPADFEPQETRILQIVRDAGVPIYGKPGFEADDLIATMARQLCTSGDWEVFMVSKDKDLRQMLTPCVHMYDAATDVVIDEKALEEKVGYSPSEAIEVQTLMGDSIDNVPGIPGIGEKTAAKLIKKYGKADEILKHLDELTPKMRENFEKFSGNLPLARSLVTLKTDVEFGFDPSKCAFTGLNAEGMRPHLETLNFRGLLDRLGVAKANKPVSKAATKYKPMEEGLFGPMFEQTAESAAAAERESLYETSAGLPYVLVNTKEHFAAFLAELRKQKRFAFDTETDDLGAMRSNMIGMSFSWKTGTGYYLPVKGPAGSVLLDRAEALAALKPILEDAAIAKVGHNLKYDLLVMREAGINVQGVALDSMVAAFLIDAGRMQYGIDPLALSLLNFRKIATDEIIGKGKSQVGMDTIALDRVANYASEDADIAWRLAERFNTQLDSFPLLRKLNDDVETPLIDVLVEMEANGIRVDPAIMKEQSGVLGERIIELREQIMKEAGVEFNPDSPKQLADVLFDRLKLKAGKKTSTGYSTDVNVLEKLAPMHPVPRLMLEYRSLTKLKNTYVDNLPEYINKRTGRIHPSFSSIGAETGRLSCSDPNLQNIPIRTDEGRRIRMAFVPGDPKTHVLLTADYSQIELRILAHFTQEPALLAAFAADEDIHRAVASQVFGVPLDQVTRDQRGQAKTINFGIIYGVSAFGLSSRIEGLTMQAAKDLIKNYNKRFPGISQFLQKCVQDAQQNGYVETILGRRRPIPDINSGVLSMRNYSERAAINSVVQGSAADLIKLAMVNVHRRLKRENRPSRMLIQVHDELVFETPIEAIEAEAAMVREEMTGAMKLTVPLRVEVGWGKNWQEVK